MDCVPYKRLLPVVQYKLAEKQNFLQKLSISTIEATETHAWHIYHLVSFGAKTSPRIQQTLLFPGAKANYPAAKIY